MEDKIFFQEKFNGIDIKEEKIVELLNYLNMCKSINSEETILECKFKKNNNKSYNFNGISVSSLPDNRCIRGTILFLNNSIVINKETTIITKKNGILDTKIIDSIDKFEKNKGKLIRTTTIFGKIYKEVINKDDIKLSINAKKY